MNNPREKLLEVAFNEIYQNGYTATSIDKILKQASMNKGSMYHFFKSKKELGLAVVNEKINSYIEDKYSVLPIPLKPTAPNANCFSPSSLNLL